MQLGSRTTGGLVSVVIVSGGSGYTAPPSVTIGGGTGAVAYSVLAGTAVDSVVVQSAGTGFSATNAVTFSGGGGTGAAATAYGNSASRPMTFFKGRHNEVYGVDGMGRGVRWDGAASTVAPIGLAGPSVAPAVTASTTTNGYYVRSIQVADGGNGYASEPSVAITGGTPTTAARARATITGGRVTSVSVVDGGKGYQEPPSVSFSGGLATGATFDVGVLGSLYRVEVLDPGSGYVVGTGEPVCLLHNDNGLTDAYVRLDVDPSGKIVNAVVMAAGTGATTSGVTASVLAGTGGGAQLGVAMQFSVNAVTVSNSGSGYYVPPAITIRPDPEDPNGSGAVVEAAVDTQGRVTGVTVVSGGRYFLPPTALVIDTKASAQAELARAFRGKYLCAVRYVDATPEDQGGPRASVISELREIDAGDGKDTLTWAVSHGTLDDRVAAMELWRTTADQSVLLFRVATIPRASFGGTYVDALTDDQLKDPDRNGYALMPVVLPSGQINARRFEIPPGEFAVGCMFQDRAWYAVDTTGRRPNALMFSEVDEPESVPYANELIVQENTGEPDKIVALVPLGSYLLIAQQAHLYKLTYVAQPVIDASISLVGYRGILNPRCYTTMGGVAFIADSVGVYAFDGNSEEAISVAIDNYWRDGNIDLSKSDKFHMSSDLSTRTVRFFYCGASDAEPVRALCYCIATKAWWEETYATAVTATCQTVLGGRAAPILGTSSGVWQKQGGTSAENIPYAIRTGALPLADKGGDRGVAVTYDPTTQDSELRLSLHYNNSSTPRANAVATDRGTGFTTALGSTAATLNLKKSRSALGDATGYAKASFAGRLSPASAGADRHVAIALAGTQAATDPTKIHVITVEGAG